MGINDLSWLLLLLHSYCLPLTTIISLFQDGIGYATEKYYLNVNCHEIFLKIVFFIGVLTLVLNITGQIANTVQLAIPPVPDN